MNITIGAQCYDGARRKSLSEVLKVEGLPIVESKPNWKDNLYKAARDPKVKALIGFAVPVLLLASGLPPIVSVGASAITQTVMAPAAVPVVAIPTGMKESLVHALDPLINLIQSLAYPIAGMMIAWGCLFMFFNREKGMTLLQNAAIGYLLVQLAPLMLKILVGLGSSV